MYPTPGTYVRNRLVSTRNKCVQQHHPPTTFFSLNTTSTASATTTTATSRYDNSQIPHTGYVRNVYVRHKWYVFVSRPITPPTFSGMSTYPILSYVYSAWNKLVPTQRSNSGLKFPSAIRAHITTLLIELNTVLDAGRGQWRARQEGLYSRPRGRNRLGVGGVRGTDVLAQAHRGSKSK